MPGRLPPGRTQELCEQMLSVGILVSQLVDLIGQHHHGCPNHRITYNPHIEAGSGMLDEIAVEV